MTRPCRRRGRSAPAAPVDRAPRNCAGYTSTPTPTPRRRISTLNGSTIEFWVGNARQASATPGPVGSPVAYAGLGRDPTGRADAPRETSRSCSPHRSRRIMGRPTSASTGRVGDIGFRSTTRVVGRRPQARFRPGAGRLDGGDGILRRSAWPRVYDTATVHRPAGLPRRSAPATDESEPGPGGRGPEPPRGRPLRRQRRSSATLTASSSPTATCSVQPVHPLRRQVIHTVVLGPSVEGQRPTATAGSSSPSTSRRRARRRARSRSSTGT
jgi:hypothetical protein